MANISISEIYGNTQSQRIQNDDLFLMSLHNNSNDTYTTAGINGLQMKCCMVLPSQQYLDRFSHTKNQTNTLNHEVLYNGNYAEYYQLTLPVDSFVHVWGEFIISNYEAFKNMGGIAQWLSIKFLHNNTTTDFLTLNPQYGSYINSDGIIANRSISFWSGYAKANTVFVLASVFDTEANKNTFVSNLSSQHSYLQISYFDVSQNS